MTTTSKPTLMRDVLIGRQPIFDARLALHAYELFFRFGERSIVTRPPPSAATAQVLTDSLTTFGLDRLVGRHPAAVNVTREFLLSDQPLPVEPDRLILEISVLEGHDDTLLASLDRWKARGFRIAIDDVKYDAPALRPLFERGDVLKVDCLGRRKDELERDVEKLLRLRKPLLAAKLESRREVDDCLGLGFRFAQGYFLERPGIVKGRTVEANRASLARLVVELQDPACDLERIEAIVQQDVGLSFRILRCVNSAAFGISRQVDSIREAVMYLGLSAVKNLACLLMLSSNGDQPRELLRLAMFRARVCEQITATLGWPDKSRSFAVGLISLFDVLLGEPMDTLLADLPVSPEIKAALLERTGQAGYVLAAVLALEKNEWGLVQQLGVDAEKLRALWMSAITWVDELDAQFVARAA